MHSTNKSIYIIYFSIVILFFACNEEFRDFIENDSNISFSTTNNISPNSRSNNDETLLPTENILFNSTGNITIKDETFIYNNQRWVCENNNYSWDKDKKGKLYIISLYPLLNNKEYTENELYNNGSLKDILIAKDTIDYKDKISLTFKHLFSRITFILADDIKENLESINITTPYSVESIDKQTGNIKINNNLSSTSESINSGNSYSFIIPPTDNTTIKIELKYSTDIKNYEITSTDFKANSNYICKIVKKDKIKGIRTEDEFILFCKYINDRIIYKKRLSAYGDTVNGKMTYRLLKDLDLSEEQCKALTPIGKDVTGFIDIFDGQGHSINNFIIDYSFKPFINTGLFMSIRKNATVKNLILNNPSIIIKDNGGDFIYAGFITNDNKGIIDNCIIKNGQVETVNSANIGCLAQGSTGIIVNCGIESVRMRAKGNESFGGIINNGFGLIINSYISDFTYITENRGALSGGIINNCKVNNETKIINCYSDIHSSLLAKDIANFVGTSTKLYMENCFYSKKDKNMISKITDKKNIKLIDILYYNTEFLANDTLLVDRLNNWVEKNQSLYSDFTLRKWVKGNNLIPATLQQ